MPSPLLDQPVAPNTRLGYLRTMEIAPQVYLGGVFIVDLFGRPQLFHYTDPIRPTRIQQVLYGHALERYCRVDIAASALMAQIPDPPAMYVVSDAFLLHAEKHTVVPVAALAATQELPFHEFGHYQHVNEREILLQATPAGNPLRVTLNAKHRKLNTVVPVLCAIGRNVSPLDPLERVTLAMAEIARELRAVHGLAPLAAVEG